MIEEQPSSADLEHSQLENEEQPIPLVAETDGWETPSEHSQLPHEEQPTPLAETDGWETPIAAAHSRQPFSSTEDPPSVSPSLTQRATQLRLKLEETWEQIYPKLEKIWQQTQPVLEKAWTQTRPKLEEFWATARPKLIEIWEQTRPRLEKAWEQIRPTTQPWWEKVRSAMEIGITRIRPVVESSIEASQPLVQRVQEWWQTVLPKIRDRLSPQMHQSLSDRTLTQILVGLMVFVVWVGSGIVSGKPTRASQPSVVQPSPAMPTTVLPTLPPVSETSPAIVSPPEVKTPSPPLDLPPEQSLIAAIQDQVATVMNQYAEGVIQSVQANFRSGRLIVKVNNDWYNLPKSRQDRLANEILTRSKELAFTKLELTDSEGAILARNPIVGNNMVILKRTPASP